MSIKKEKVFSVMESILFANPEPTPISTFYSVFENDLDHKEVLSFLEEFIETYNEESRGLVVKKINKGFQLRTKPENKDELLKTVAKKSFRLSGPSLEVLAAIAYNQPCPKQDIDQIRGVESGHLIRTLMEKNLVTFAGKSDLPGKPSLYKTTDKFLEIFSFNSIKDLPSEDEINELLPDIQVSEEKEELHQITDTLSETDLTIPYQQDEEENQSLKDTLKQIPTTVDFLEEQKRESKRQEKAAAEESSQESEEESPEEETSL